MFLLNLFTFKYCSHPNVYDPRNSVNLSNSTKFSNFSSNLNLKMNNESILASSVLSNTCSTTTKAKNCADLNGKCVTTFDAFYPLAAVLICFGVVWHFLIKKTIYRLNNLPLSHWKLN